MKTVNVSKKVLDDNELAQVELYLEKHPPEFYWDYRDSLTEDQVRLILAGKIDEAIESVEQNCWDGIYYIEKDALKDAIESLDLDVEDFDYLFEDAWNRIDGMDVSIDLRQPARNTDAFLAMQFDCEHIAYWDDYYDVEDELEFWGINPKDMAEFFEGEWPDIPGRTPRISPRSMADAWINMGYHGVWVALIDGSEYLEDLLDGKLEGDLVLSAGANVTIYDYVNGAGSMIVPTLVDIPIKKDDVYLDKDYHYNIQRCYGLITSAWNGIIRKED